MAGNSLVWYFIGLMVTAGLFLYLAWQLGKLLIQKPLVKPNTQINETFEKSSDNYSQANYE